MGKSNCDFSSPQLFYYRLVTYSLYRGGIRGIVELEILRLIENVWGGGLRIQDFFDLIVGTRYVFLTEMIYSIFQVLNYSLVRVA